MTNLQNYQDLNDQVGVGRQPILQDPVNPNEKVSPKAAAPPNQSKHIKGCEIASNGGAFNDVSCRVGFFHSGLSWTSGDLWRCRPGYGSESAAGTALGSIYLAGKDAPADPSGLFPSTHRKRRLRGLRSWLMDDGRAAATGTHSASPPIRSPPSRFTESDLRARQRSSAGSCEVTAP